MSIEANIEKIQKEIEQACERCGREPSEVTLVAVSKFHPWQAVCRAADAGVQVFGESRVQEAKLKISQCPPASAGNWLATSNPISAAMRSSSLR